MRTEPSVRRSRRAREEHRAHRRRYRRQIDKHRAQVPTLSTPEEVGTKPFFGVVDAREISTEPSSGAIDAREMSTKPVFGVVDTREMSTEPSCAAIDDPVLRIELIPGDIAEARLLRRSQLSGYVAGSRRDGEAGGAH